MSEGRCPILDLPELAIEHWDTESLCGMFECDECVAAPEDLGYPGEERLRSDEDEEGMQAVWEIPF